MCALFVGVIFARGILLRCLRAWERNRGRCVQLSELGWAGFPSSDTTHTPATDRRGFLVKSPTHPRRAMVIRRFGPEIPRVPRTRSASLLPDQPVPIRPEKAWDVFRFGSDGISWSTSGTPVPVDSLGGGPISPASKAGKRTPLSAPTSPGAVVHNCETPHVHLWGVTGQGPSVNAIVLPGSTVQRQCTTLPQMHCIRRTHARRRRGTSCSKRWRRSERGRKGWQGRRQAFRPHGWRDKRRMRSGADGYDDRYTSVFLSSSANGEEEEHGED